MTLVIITSVLHICPVYHVCGTFDIMNKLYNICSCCLHIFRVQGLILFIYLLSLSVLVQYIHPLLNKLPVVVFKCNINKVRFWGTGIIQIYLVQIHCFPKITFSFSAGSSDSREH